MTIVRREREIGTSVLLSADIGMIPPGETHVMPDRNARQTLLATRHGGLWLIELFQNTPVALDQDATARDQLVWELDGAFSERGHLPS